MRATIQVNARERLGKISPLIYGVMFENCGRCMYDGLWVGEDSTVPNWRGVRKDVMELLRAFSCPIIRWPGGTPSETYHWREGVGPRNKRPKSLLGGSVMNSPAETHAFGTDEYMHLSENLGFAPYLCANVGTGTAEEAANWVEYCNAAGDTSYAALRATNGHPEPYRVQHWGIGNESYFWHDAPAYARIVRHYAKLMKLIDPTIALVAAGKADAQDWNRTLLTESGDAFDYISIHVFYGTRQGMPAGADYESLVASPLDVERRVRELEALIRQATGTERIRIMIDEWAVWNAEARPQEGAEQNLSLQDALFAAGMFHMFHRTRDRVDVGILANLMNSTNAVTTRGGRLLVSPVYHALALYAKHAGTTALDCVTEVDSYRTAAIRAEVPYLDCSAALDESNGRLALAVVNRNRQQDITSDVSIEGRRVGRQARVFEINADNETATNDWDAPERVVTVQRDLPGTGEHFSYRYPAHSVTLLEIPLQDGKGE
ncbi:MAG: alpha-L-arabinofuranosidase C-terminal domain-containing protein [Planctomycetota bacterium]